MGREGGSTCWGIDFSVATVVSEIASFRSGFVPGDSRVTKDTLRYSGESHVSS